MKDKIRLIYNKIENRIDEICDDGFVSKENQQEYETLTDLEDFIDSLPEEPASKDLEEASIAYSCANPSERSNGMYDQTDIEWAFEAGAEWQKNQMKETLQTEYEKGRFDMREEMMKNTVLETEVLMDCDGDGIETPYEEWLTLEDTEIPCVPDGFKNGDIVKVVLIKEDLP